MALFGKKTETKKKAQPKKVAVAPVSAESAAKTATVKGSAGAVLLSPRITEKGSYLAEKRVYVFNVEKNANKKQISEAIQAVFGVVPRMVNIVHVPGKGVVSRTTNRAGRTASGKKAYVSLKSGDKIDIA